MNNRATLLILLFLLTFGLTAQVAWLTPENPGIDDTVTLTYNVNSGNRGLEGWQGDVYLHTGVITEKSIDGGDWKHVTGNWGHKDTKCLMKPAGDGLYRFTFVINDYYRIRKDEVPQQLAFVFRNEDGSKVGKTKNNEDIFLPVNGYVPPAPKEVEYLFEKRQYLSYSIDGSTLRIQTDHGQVAIRPYTPKIIEIKHFKDLPPDKDSSDAVILKPTYVPVSLSEESDRIIFSTDSLQLIVWKSPFHLSFVYHNDTLLNEAKGYFRRTDNNGLQFRIGRNEKYYGLGERAIDFSLNGHRYNLYNRPKYGYEFPALNLNYSVPMVLSSKKYLLLFDNPQKGYCDVGETEPGILEWGAIGGVMKYFVVAGSGYYDLMKQWGTLTGTQPLPPRWALGNLQSRMAYRTQHETDSIVSLMQAKDFPVDAVILDFYWFGDSIMGTMGRLKWYKPNWPEPEQMIDKFRKKGVKTVLITEPYILDSLKNFDIADELAILATDSLGKTYVNKGFYFGYGALIDIFKPEAREWFWKQYNKQIENGVAGWWGDLGEPENHPSDQFHVNGSADEVHNIYAHYWHKMLFEKYRKYYPNERLFNLNRAGYAGSQRYSIYPWTGDVSRSWGGYKAQVSILLHMSMSGLPFIHSDAGGFAQGTKDEELYIRWLQMACFSPILRPHGSGIPSEPVYFNQQTQEIVRHFMKIRYRLLPYLYTMAAQAHLAAFPIMRPLFFDYPEDTITYNLGNQYLLGESMLVAPVLQKGQYQKEVYLPSGKWYSFWDTGKFTGGKWHTVDSPLEEMPVFVKAGSFIPMVRPVNSTDDYSSKILTIRYYPSEAGDSSGFNMFEDDGKTFGTLEREEYEILRFSSLVSEEGNIEIRMMREGWDFNGRPRTRNLRLEIAGQDSGSSYTLTLNGKKIPKRKNKTPGYYFNEKGILVAETDWDGSLQKFTIRKK